MLEIDTLWQSVHVRPIRRPIDIYGHVWAIVCPTLLNQAPSYVSVINFVHTLLPQITLFLRWLKSYTPCWPRITLFIHIHPALTTLHPFYPGLTSFSLQYPLSSSFYIVYPHIPRVEHVTSRLPNLTSITLVYPLSTSFYLVYPHIPRADHVTSPLPEFNLVFPRIPLVNLVFPCLSIYTPS